MKRKRPGKTPRGTRRADTPFFYPYLPPFVHRPMRERDQAEPITYSQSKHRGRKRPVDVKRIADGLEQLAFRSTEGSIDGEIARRQFLHLVASAVHRLNSIVEKHLADWQGHAAARPLWPVMASLHPHYVKGMEKGAKIRDFLERLYLGAHLTMRFSSKAKSDLYSPITQTAIDLIGYVARVREGHLRIVAVISAKKLQPDHAEQLRQEHLNRMTGWRRDAAKLPLPCKANAPQWSDVAIECLKESYPHPEQLQELADEIGKYARHSTATHRETLGRIGDRIKHRLHATICKLLIDPPS